MAEENWDALLRIPENIYAVGNAAFRRFVDDVQARARENVSMGRPGLIPRSGKLYESIQKGPYKQLSPDSYGEQRIYSNLVYSRVHEFGAVITPKKGPFLVFRLWTFAPSGPWVRARRVEIPARPYLGPAAKDAVPHWPELVREAIDYIFRGLR
jgi:phage gpG-like protein